MVMSFNASNFQQLFGSLEHTFRKYASRVETESWQGKSTEGKPDMITHELLNVTAAVSLFDYYANQPTVLDPFNLQHWRDDIRPTLPWADDHFLERVGGQPLNPGETYKYWLHGGNTSKFLNDRGQFNHTYMERFWPRHAGCGVSDPDVINFGVRGAFGDVSDVVDLLVKEPHTRQAYLPIFFPEDTGIGDGGRKPCTLGYHFIMRNKRLHCYYPLRSCDFANHFRDDCYLAVRLMLWIIEQCQAREAATYPTGGPWAEVMPSSLTIHCTSFHLFRNDFLKMCRDEGENVWQR